MTNILSQTRRPDITFARSGRIQISARVARLLSLSIGDAINIATDNGEYLLYVQNRASQMIGSHIATCYPSKKGSHHYRANSVALCNAILDIDRIPIQASYYVGSPYCINGTKYLPIITKRAL